MEDLVKVFNRAISQSKKVIVNADDNGIKNLSGNFITFGLNEADYTAKNIQSSSTGTLFDAYHRNEYLTTIFIQLTGTHNIYNTLAVLSAMNEAELTVDCKKHFF